MSYDEHLISMAGGDGEPDLNAIQARADKATKGPWNADDGSYNVYDAEAYMVCADLADGDTSEFIAHARTDVPALLALVRDQAAKLGRVEAQLDEWASYKAFPDAEESQRWYSLGKRHAADSIRAAITAPEASK